MTALSSGMVDAFYTEPLAAAAYQWFGVAKNMSTMKIGPLVGGIVMTERAWRQIPDQYKGQFQAAVERAEGTVLPATDALEQQAMKVMIDNGLVVNQASADSSAQWCSLLTKGFNALAGRVYSSEIYDEVLGLVSEYRVKHGG